MIIGHEEEHGFLVLSDGHDHHRVNHDAFDWMQPHAQGGIHPGVTEEHHGWLCVPPRADVTDSPVTPVAVTTDDPLHPGTRTTVTMLPINAYLQAHYGPDGQVVTVPINGDAGAQRLHWLKRNAEERAEMKALLKWMGAWRLTEDGEMPGPDAYVMTGLVDHRGATLPPEGE